MRVRMDERMDGQRERERSEELQRDGLDRRRESPAHGRPLIGCLCAETVDCGKYCSVPYGLERYTESALPGGKSRRSSE